jgi:hypothetical protein
MPVSPLFPFHKLNAQGIELAVKIARDFDQLLKELSQVCPDGREFSIVKTKLEEASFFAKKSIANVPENQLEVQ